MQGPGLQTVSYVTYFLLHDAHKTRRPEHPLAEKLMGLDELPTPLFAQPMVH